MLFHHALSPRRFARSLVTVLALTFIQTALPPVISPIISTPKAEAVTNTYSPAQATEWLVPANVTQISVTIKGGSGGVGGQDCGAGCNNQAGGPRGSLTYAFTVSPGDVVGVYPGRKGVDGISSGNGGGGAAGQDTSLNGTFDGGSGGNAGSSGFSGAGGGGGAASVLLINSVLRAVAGGAGGGGGAANVSNSGRVGVEYASGSLNGTSFTGGNGGTTSSCTTTSGSTTNDGGGSGGSGGGYYGGAAMPVYAASAGECAGNGGVRGGNYIFTNAGEAVIGNTGVAQGSETVANSDGSIVIDYTPTSNSACTETSQTVDIYRVIKISTVGGCTWAVPAGVTTVDIFAVGGGGAGGAHGGSGGGGGAAISRTALAVTASTNLTVKIGYGGGASFTDGWSGGTGDSTTISFPSGLFLSANGGSMGVKGDGTNSKVGGLGGTAANGGFAGGAGGTSATTINTRGLVGKTGTSNYFLGTLTEFGGGGGGGTHKNACSPLEGQLGASGGAAGASCNSNVNSAGGSALAETGGGGGGGGYGTSGNTLGGKGGSGVVYLRYTLNAADAFPSALSSSLAGRWTPEGLQVLDSTRTGWVDSSGYYAAGTITGSPTVTTQGPMDGANATGSTKTNLVAAGNTGAKATLVAANIPTYTIFHIARYVTGGTQQRIITAKDNNWLSGHYNSGTYKTAYHNNDWMTSYVASDVKWLLSTDQVRLYRANGSDISYNSNATNIYNSTTTPTGFGINNFSTEQSNWQTLDILAFNRHLTNGEIRAMEIHLSRIYGLTLSYEYQHTETDTAMSFNGNQYFYTQYTYGNVINDTFTIEAWIKPTSTCASTRCVVFSKEYAVMFGVYNGSLYYIMYGTNTAWQWVDNIYKISMDEWHHIALVKRGVANTNGGLDIYVDGQLVYTKAGSPYLTSTSNVTFSSTDVIRQNDDQWTYIGTRLDTLDRFYGNIDEVKVWKVARTGDQIRSDMNSTETSDTQLQYYWDFNKAVGTSSTRVPNLGAGGPSRGDLIPAGTTTYSDVKVTTPSAAYTTLTFPRSYLNQYGGWKTPDSITTVSALVVGGGGGGGYNSGGGGGGGGVTYTPIRSVSGVIPVTVGVGGAGSNSSGSTPNSGFLSSLGTTNSPGGNAGSVYETLTGGSGIATSSGTSGAGGSGTSSSTVSGGNGGAGISSSISGATATYGNGGGGGGWTTNTNGGFGGNSSSYTCCGSGGSTGSRNGKDGTGNFGGGGGAGSASNFAGGSGGSGVVILRFITAVKPTYTKPTNSYLNVGMTETFTTNVAQDSATAQLTRTFRWESTTGGSGGTFTTIKQGTGAANAAFSWVPSDTSTSGDQFLYRLVVTDSDTAGLFITDSSTVFAVINNALVMTGPSTIKKQINIARNETFTVADGTPGYRYTLTPVIPGITLDTSTVGSAVLKISDTASAGTYLETLTVTDSVSASVVIPLSISISPPPTLVNSSSVIENDLVFNIDMANSASYSRSTGLISDISGTKKQVTINGGSTFSDDYSGNLALSSSQHISATGFGQLNSFTIEAYVNLKSLSSGQPCIFTSEQTVTNIAYFLCLDTGRTIFTGFYNGSWTYKRTSQTLTLGEWTHVVGTFDPAAPSSRNQLYINGAVATLSDWAENATLIPPTPTTDKIFINKVFWSSTAPTSAMNIGFIRLYRSALDQAKVTQNYNATKDRFAANNLNQLKPSQKYGTLNIDSFTVSSGGDTKTVGFAVGNRAGILWDTATAGVVRLTVQESLTPGIYDDTITVTDNFGQSTTLPIKFTVSKADTITVIAGAATTQVYNTAQATSLPNFTISGLVSSDTGTVLRKYTGIDWTKPCAQGGGCEVGDTGPGGGTIFYISPTVINAATGISSGGTYLEVAPKNWWGTNSETTTAWATIATSVTGTSGAIGSGAENTRLINTALPTTSVAAKRAADLNFGTKSDWFLPSTLEVKEMYDALYAPGLAGDLSVLNYWTSTQGSNTAQADTYWFGGGGSISATNKLQPYTLRPIRAYSPDTITVTTVPTDVDSYTVTIDTVTMTTGSLSYYENVVFQRSGLNISKARQNPLDAQLYGATFGVPFTISLLGGSGSGAVTESLTAGSTATGCVISARVLTSTTAGACNLQIKKAYSRNYLTETTTAVIYLLNWVINQPTNQVGSGPTIALNGESSVTRDPIAAPMITSLSTYTAQAGVTQIVIYGAGFNSLDTANIVVKFWRNKIASGFTVNAGNSEITVTVPVDATTGKVTVTTPNGLAVSELALTITP